MNEPAPSPRRRVWPKRAALILLGLVAGLSISELVFRARDRGAFPHLHIYVEDPELGVRLQPGATQKVALPGDRVTSVRINADGFRGAALSLGRNDDVIVVGDSQVFGLGVEEEETFSAKLETALGERHVINAGVPTYGPPEYEAVAKRLLDASPYVSGRRTVVYVINVANDLAEANRPNKTRHKVWDGWAVRAETAPDTVTSFPGRDWLYRESHAFFALRSWLYARGPKAAERLLPSEGEVKDLLGAADLAQGEHAKAHKETEALALLWRTELEKAGADATQSQEAWTKLLQEMPEAIPADKYGNEYKRNKGDPGDLVERGETYFEGGGKADYAYLVKGAAVRLRVEELILAHARDVLAAEKTKLVLDSYEKRAKAELRVAALRKKSLEIVRAWSPLRPSLERMKKLCDSAKADLVVVVLPVDVQVSASEWKKYGRDPIDVSATRVLNRDIVHTAESLGVRTLDLLPVLEKAQPGAFFEKDLHLTPKGHEAVATALATKIKEEEPATKPPFIEPPPGRTHVPLASAWAAAKPLVTNGDFMFITGKEEVATGSAVAKGVHARFRGKVPDGCEARRVAEWFRVVCTTPAKGAAPTGVIVRKGPDLDVMAMSAPGVAMVLAPLVEDADRLEVDFAWGDAARTLVIKYEPDITTAGTSALEWSLTFSEPRPLDDAAKKAFVATPGADALCACRKSVHDDATCAGAIGAPDADCTQTWGTECKRLLECTSGQPVSLPICATGFVHKGAAHRCTKL